MTAERVGTTIAAELDLLAALIGSGHAFAIADSRQNDLPLVWVSTAFEQISGYTSEQVIGRNCRFLQGPGTDPEAIGRIGRALRDGVRVSETLLNYRPDGAPWWNNLVISPIRDADGEITNFVGVQTDVTDRVLLEERRDQARADAVDARSRLRLLAEATLVLGQSLDPDVALDRLTDLVVPSIADWCSILLLQPDSAEPGGVRTRLTLTHRDPALAEVTAWILSTYRADRDDSTPQSEVLRTGVPVLLADVGEDYIAAATQDGDLAMSWKRLGMRSCIVVALPARAGRIGCLTLVRTAERAAFDEADLEFAADLGRRAGIALDNARLYAAEHSMVLALQRSLLPELPKVPGLETASRYLPSSERLEVGGDWFDVLALPDGATGLTVGDVMGHDINAAAAMGQLRSVLRSYAWEGDRPTNVLDRLDRLVSGLNAAQLATCVYGRLERPGADGARPLRWSNAGHPPPLLRHPDGRLEFLSAGHSWMIGIGGTHRDLEREGHVLVHPGSVLILYTDGLIEDRRRDVDQGMAELSAALGQVAMDATPDEVADHLIAALQTSERDDDVCLLVVRVS